MNDNEKLKKAIIYVERLASGNNPINNQKLTGETILNDSNVIRCMYFIKNILQDVYSKGYKRKDFPYAVLKNYKYECDKTISKIFIQINDLIDTYEYNKVKSTNLLKWLKENGYLSREEVFGETKSTTFVTEKGKELGLYNQKRILDTGRSYIAVMYNKKAQDFIINNLEMIDKGTNF